MTVIKIIQNVLYNNTFPSCFPPKMNLIKNPSPANQTYYSMWIPKRERVDAY